MIEAPVVLLPVGPGVVVSFYQPVNLLGCFANLRTKEPLAENKVLTGS